MGRVSRRNPCFRTRDEIVRDVAFVLNAPLAYGTQEVVIQSACWAWTEFDGKYKGCRFWTRGAMMQFLTAAPATRHKDLRHEHAVPRKVVSRMLRDVKSITPDAVGTIFHELLHGVVVIKEEDALLNVEFRQSMPIEFFDSENSMFRDCLLRYKKCGIEVVKPPTEWWRESVSDSGVANDQVVWKSPDGS